MAAASYTTDLTVINDATTSISGWAEIPSYGATDGAELDGDYAIYGSSSITSGFRKTGLGSIVYNNGTAVTPVTDGAFLIWFKFLGPNSLATLDSGGIQWIIGSSASDYLFWYVGGSDTYPYGGWINMAINPSGPPRTGVIGTPNGDLTYIGIGCNQVNAISKGNPFGVDILRYGRGESRFTGGDLANGYATFLGFSLFNDNSTTGRLGLIQKEGSGYLWKGLMSLGLTGTAVDMRDSNVVITIDDTTNVTTPYNRIEVHNASSNIEWKSVLFNSLGTQSPGQFEMIDNATFTMDTCSFSDMSTFIFQSNATLTDTSFIRCGQVTQGGATITSSTFDSSVATTSLLTTSLELVTDSSFISDGSNHAIELTSIGDGTMDWDNTLEDYVTGVAGSPASTSSTGNEGIYVNVGSGTLTINVGAGYTVPSIRTAGATVNVVAGQVTTKLIVNDINTKALIQNARALIVANTGGGENHQDSVTITNASTTATVTHTAHGLSTGEKVFIEGADLEEYNGVKTITVTGVNTYTYVTAGTPTSPATGTILSTSVIIDGVTDVNGEITDTRSLSASQPIIGRVRRATTGTLYKTSPVQATIDNITGLTLSVQMIPDE